jgi:peroxiredoxin Q/BCP
MVETGKALGKSILSLPLALSDGTTARLADYAGRWLVLYFYPKDSTPGCTVEGNDFNALLPRFAKLGATVVGVSRDSLKSHANFCGKQGFRFLLASDADEKLCNAFGVIQPKKLYGREFIGVERSTFLIDPAGVVRAAWRKVKVPGHAEAVLESLQTEQRTHDA